MKKILFTLGTAAALVSTGASTTGKAAVLVQEIYKEQCTYVSQNTEGNNQWKDILEDCGVQVEILYQGSCPVVPEGGDMQPETEKPEVPDTQLPEGTMPESPSPESPSPESPSPESPSSESPSPEEPSLEEPQPPVNSPEENVHPYVLRILELVNKERAAAGLKPVVLDVTACGAAQVRAKETVTSFSHTRPDGRSFTTALTEQGISYRMAGENIAWGQRNPEQVMEGWMNSAGHRANILKESFTHIGIGYHQENGVNYWTQLFFN